MRNVACYATLLALFASGCAQTSSHRAPGLPSKNAGDYSGNSHQPVSTKQVGVDIAVGNSDDEATPSSSVIPVAVAIDATPTRLGLNDLEQVALKANPTLLELQATVDAANGRWLQVGLRPNPALSYSGQEIGNDGRAGQHGLFVQQEFVTANKLGRNRNTAAWDVRRAEQELAAQRLRILTDVRQRFYATLVAQERVKVAEELRGIAQRAVEKARELIKAQEPKSVLTQSEIEAELVAMLVDNVRAQRKARWRQLTAVLGRPGLPLQNVDGELSAKAPQLAWGETLDRIQRESPELAAAAANIEKSRWALNRARVEATPNITVQAGVSYDYGSSDPFAAVQVSLPIPVYNFNQGRIAETNANVAAAEKALRRVELSLQERLAKAYQEYEQARQQASRYETNILKKAKENLELNRKSYEAGDSSYLAVLTAQRSYTQVRMAWLNAVEQLWSSTAFVEGMLLAGSLNEPVR